jgi:hypothetical protein
LSIGGSSYNGDGIDEVFTSAQQDAKLDRFHLANFRYWKSLRQEKLEKAVDDLNAILRESGQVFFRQSDVKNPKRALQKYGFARVEIVQPGDDYREAKLRVLISDDIRILDKEAKVHSQRIRAFDFSTKDFDRVKILSYADHKINT